MSTNFASSWWQATLYVVLQIPLGNLTAGGKPHSREALGIFYDLVVSPDAEGAPVDRRMSHRAENLTALFVEYIKRPAKHFDIMAGWNSHSRIHYVVNIEQEREPEG